ncbi:MAG: GH116 family glycosyl-hydrolase [Bacteroidales bacterium]
MRAIHIPVVLLIISAFQFENVFGSDWPVLKRYDQEHTYNIALPIGGIGTGTVSLGGRGNLQDWEIMNRPAKGYNPGINANSIYPNSAFFSLYTEISGKKDLRLLEGPVPFYLYQGSQGAVATNHGLPRFKEASFDAAYPFGQVNLKTPQVPVEVKIKAFNPLIPGDIDNSSIPMAVIDFELANTSDQEVSFSVCGSMPNFIGEDGSQGKAVGNRNTYITDQGIKGIFFSSTGVDKGTDQWGEMALVTTSKGNISYRTTWLPERFGVPLLDFWDDLSKDGQLDTLTGSNSSTPMASLAVSDVLPAHAKKTIRFLITWYFPNRTAWSSKPLKNYYATKYSGARDIAVRTVPQLERLEAKTAEFVDAFCKSDIPEEVKEAALFNVSTLRTQTCFRLSDGNFFAWEGCGDKEGNCMGNCTHVWNYETATAFLFGNLARSLRRIEFGLATLENGLMCHRVKLPLDEIPAFPYAFADGQMGCLLKLYREWQLSGDDAFLKELYPKAKSALNYSWIKGGWDANQDGVFEGVQPNTMDVEYYGPNPQITIWYLGALRAMEEMAKYMKDREMASKCRKLFESGSRWTDENLFNGEYYEQKIADPKTFEFLNMNDPKAVIPDYQLGSGCFVDQLVGQYLAHVCGLGYLVKKENVAMTLKSIMKYNYLPDLSDHFNCMRTFALADEAALVMASYPKSRPVIPMGLSTEFMTGFEYAAATAMIYEGQTDDGLKCIRNVRDRYDGRKRSPFDEAECGHHYGRAMASWSALLAMTGFHYSGVAKEITFGNIHGKFFWSNGYAYGTAEISQKEGSKAIQLKVLNGKLDLLKVSVEAIGSTSLKSLKTLNAGESGNFEIKM